jgi:cyclic pyranopterin monophosphate synthase
MIDITAKSTTLRTATAVSHVVVSPDTVRLINNRKVPKGDVLSVSRTAGILAVKNTPSTLPFCHPIPIEYADVHFKVENDGLIIIECTVSAIARTGCEMEALNGAMTAALNMYDMLKPVDKSIIIEKTWLKEKKGGKSSFINKAPEGFRASVAVCSDSISEGRKQDKAGKVIIKKLQETGVEEIDYQVMPDEPNDIRSFIQAGIYEGYDLLVLTGGTGLSPRDITPETVRPLLDREIPGVMEAARQYGMERTAYAMLSRGIAGVAGKTIILTLPGSTRGAEESMNALFPSILHVYRVLRMTQHTSQESDQ